MEVQRLARSSSTPERRTLSLLRTVLLRAQPSAARLGKTREWRARDTLAAVIAGAVLASLLRFLYERWQRYQRTRAEFLWRRHVDFGVVQACILTTEHLQSLGRVEKRTLFVKPISEVFRNEYILSRVLECAEESAADKDPMLMRKLSLEDKWHVLNTCTNHLSSCFAPYHVFFNEARRVKSYYRSAWYCFTLTASQTQATGRWFITPHKPVGVDDCGSLRIRIILMNEQELRDVHAGNIEAPESGLFNGRHESRWEICQKFADLFGRQLRRVTGSETSPDWGTNLCGTLKKKAGSHQRLAQLPNMANAPVPEYEPDDNAILRIHIPFPGSNKPAGDDDEAVGKNEGVSGDVVLFE